MKNLVVVQEFIDKQHTRYRVGEKISAEKSYADLLLKKDLVDEVFTEKELKEFAEAEKAEAEAKAKKAKADKAKTKRK